jgi:hypothetical protein
MVRVIFSAYHQLPSYTEPRYASELSTSYQQVRWGEDNRPYLLICELFAALRLHPDTPCLASAQRVG